MTTFTPTQQAGDRWRTISALVGSLDHVPAESEAEADVLRAMHCLSAGTFVQSGWLVPGSGAPPPNNYRICLVDSSVPMRIAGRLDSWRSEPYSAVLEYEDEGVWTTLPTADEATLLQFARNFYLGY